MEGVAAAPGHSSLGAQNGVKKKICEMFRETMSAVFAKMMSIKIYRKFRGLCKKIRQSFVDFKKIYHFFGGAFQNICPPGAK